MIHLTSGIPSRSPNGYEILKATAMWDWYENNEYGQIEVNMNRGIIPQIGVKNVKPNFALWGDSHAMSYIPAMDILSKKYGLSGCVTTLSATPPIIDIDASLNIAKFNSDVITFIKSHPQIKTVFIAAYWSYYIKSEDDLRLLTLGLTKTVDTLQQMKRKVILIEDFPSLSFEPIRYLWLTSIYKKLIINPDDNRTMYYKHNKNINKVLFELSQKKKILLLSPEHKMFDKAGHVIIFDNNKLLYRNSDHISTEGSRFLTPVFDDVFKNMVNEK
ncbi:MAG: hypothetical protein JZU70_00735 [Chlorobium sp.]|nr:hypothetical protein [Chlorobium sp.]